MTARPLVRELVPALAAEIERALVGLGATELAASLADLEAWDRCGCDDGNCSSFYTGPRPPGAWSNEGDHETLPLDVGSGMVNLDVVAGRIRYVEVLYRSDAEAVQRLSPAPRR